MTISRIRNAFFFLGLLASFQICSCGKKDQDKATIPADTASELANWDLKSDVPATDLKAKDL